MGETGYFVTYKNTDPLFSVDLSDPENPKVLGELKITGFSSYLHFYGENRLLGIGWETDPDTGNTIGMKCSMFDISDPSDVKETDRFVLKDVSFCDALTNYRSILAAPKKGLFGFAYGMYGSNSDIYDSSENFYYSVFSCDEEDGFVPNAYVKMNDCAHAILALESVFQERSILLIEIIGEMSCFQVEAAEDVGWIVAPGTLERKLATWQNR